MVDALIDQIVVEKDADRHFALVHALDRVMLANFYAVPLYYRDTSWVAYWDQFGRPERAPKYATGITSTWWSDEAKAN